MSQPQDPPRPATRENRLADLVVAIAAGAIIAAAVVIGQFRIPLPALCPSVLLFHRECAGCGLTRSFAAIGRGDLAAANALNPFGPVLFAWLVALIVVRAGKRFAPRFRWWFEIDLAFGVAVAIAVVTRLLTFYVF